MDIVLGQPGYRAHKITISQADVGRDITELLRTQAEPPASGSIYVQARVFKRVREAGVKVILDGQGAD